MTASAEAFAEWFRRRGYRVVRTASSYWVEYAFRMYQAFPYHDVISPSEDELQELLRAHRAAGLRYSTPLDAPHGAPSYHVVYTGREYPLELLARTARYRVRQGLKIAKVEQVAFDWLADAGWSARADTLKRQGIARSEDAQSWRRLCEAAASVEAWAAFVDGQLAASIVAFASRSDGCYSILHQQSRSEYLPRGINNALTYVVTRAAVESAPPFWLFYGLDPLGARASVDEFKFRMGYSAKAVRQRVVFHPAVSPLMNRGMHAALKVARRVWPGSATLAKGEGMLRFYLGGRGPQQPVGTLSEASVREANWRGTRDRS